MQNNTYTAKLRECLKVDGEPVPKGRPRVNKKTGRIYTDQKTAAFESKVRWLCAPVMLAGPVQVEIWAIFSRPKRLMRASDPDGLCPYEGRVDLDNVIKAVNDGLQSRAFKNDNQVCEIHAFARYAEKATPKKARTEILVYEMKPTKPIKRETDADMAPSTKRLDPSCSS